MRPGSKEKKIEFERVAERIAASGADEPRDRNALEASVGLDSSARDAAVLELRPWAVRT